MLVIGAAGKTGRAVVEQAVAAGHHVTAFVHHATEYTAPANVRVVEGDAADSAAMDAAVLGQEAVLDTIGGKTPYKVTTLEPSAAHAIIAAMQHHGVRRLVVTSMLGVGESIANAPFYERLLVATFLRGADQDKTAMEGAVEASELDWVILRPAILTDAPATGQVRVFEAETGENAHQITRADLAAFMVAQLTTDEHLHQAVTIANN
ncbi:NAD(P)-dependent oxidoreductase [Hymenobacter arcticus]